MSKISTSKVANLLIIVVFSFSFAAFSFVPKAQADTTSGLVRNWKFDEGSGNSAADSASGNGAVLNNGPVWTSGKLGNALLFDGTDDFLSISNGPNFGTGSFTYSLWVNVTQNVSGYDMPWYKGGACSGCPGYDMELGVDGWAANISDGTSSAAASFGSETLNQWVLLTVVVDRSNNLLRTYSNTSIMDSVSIAGFGSTTGPYAATIGGESPYFFHGMIDDVRIYSRALSINDITELYNAGQSQGDTTAPIISNISSSSITQSGATISWSTNEASDTQIDYGTTTSYGSQTTLNSSLVTIHLQTLSGLSANTTYNYRVRSRDAAGNLAVSSNNTFTTSSGTIPPPQPPPPAAGTVFYVALASQGGNDGNSGSISSPFATVAHGLSVMQPGYTLYLRAGTYNQTACLGQFTVIPSGNPGSPITVKSYPGETATLTANGGLDCILGPSHGESYQTWENLIFDGLNRVTFAVGGANRPHHWRFINSEFKNARQSAICTGANFSEYINLHVHDNGIDDQDHGIYMAGADNLIDGGLWHDNSGLGVHIFDSGKFTVSRNTVRNAKLYNNGTGGIIMTSGEDNVAYNNLIYNNVRTGASISESDDSNNGQYYNNTVYGNGGFGILVGGGGSNAVIKNNISYNNGAANYYDYTNAAVTDKNLIGIDPKFQSPSTGDFHLTSQSINVIDQGVNLSHIFTTDFNGATRQGAWDIGAYELGGIVIPPPPPTDNQLPIGYLDSASNGNISGWSYDPDLAGSSNTVQVFFNGPVGVGALVSSFPTNVMRGDVNAEYGITGIHGYTFAIPAGYYDGLPHSVYVYAIDINDASKSFLLYGAPKSFTLNPVLNPDTTNPTASITSPAAGTVSGTITYSAAASDPTVSGQVNSGLSLLSLFIDGNLYATSTTGSISRSLDTTTLTNANHQLTATARDNAGNTFTTGAITINVNNAPAQKFPRTITLSSLEGLSAIPANQQITVSIMSGSTVLRAQTLTPTSNNYTVTFQASDPQVVNIRVKADKYLSRLLSGIDTTVNSPIVISVPQLLAGDLNNDNSINTLDYSIMNTNWNQTSPTADINGDGFVNSLDFAILKNNFNRVGE